MTRESVRVLYVDDNPLDRELVRDSLERVTGGFQLTEAKSQADFELELADDRFDVVLSDFNILGFEGLEVISAVHALRADLPVIIVTGTGSEEVAVEAMKRGAADYVIKTPKHIRRLPATIRSVLATARVRRERQEADEALRKSEARYRAIVEDQTEFICRCLPDGTCTFVNQATCKLLDEPSEAILGKTYSRFVHPDDLEMVQGRLAALTPASPVAVVENRNVLPNGDVRWAQWSNRGIFDEAGNLVEIQSVGRDVTEQREAERARRESERFLRSTLDALSSHIAILDETGTILSVNRAWRDFAQNNEAVVERVLEGANYLEMCDRAIGGDAEQAHQVATGIRAVLRGESEGFELEYPCHSPDQERWFVGRVTRFMGEASRRVVVAHEDITERVHWERALHQSERRLRRLVENMPVMMDAFDETLTIAAWNRECERVTGYTAGEMIGNPRALELLYPAPESREFVISSLQDEYEDFRDIEFTLTCKDGSSRIVSWSNLSRSIPIPGWATWAVGIDVTDRKRAQSELRQRDAELAYLQRVHAVGEMATTLAHEINQPLYAINNYVRGARRRLRKEQEAIDVEALAEAMDRVSTEVSRAVAILARLRDFVRRREPHRSTVDLGALLVQAVELMEPDIRAKRVSVSFRIAPDLPTMHVDSVQVEQVVVNLVRNALEAMADVPADRRQLTITAQSVGEQLVEVGVHDCGTGLSSELADRLFEAFVTTKQDGLGLGLAISRSIVESHGGKIWAVHNAPHGVAIHFTLPAVPKE